GAGRRLLPPARPGGVLAQRRARADPRPRARRRRGSSHTPRRFPGAWLLEVRRPAERDGRSGGGPREGDWGKRARRRRDRRSGNWQEPARLRVRRALWETSSEPIRRCIAYASSSRSAPAAMLSSSKRSSSRLIETDVVAGTRGAYRLATPVEEIGLPATIQSV